MVELLTIPDGCLNININWHCDAGDVLQPLHGTTYTLVDI